MLTDSNSLILKEKELVSYTTKCSYYSNESAGSITANGEEFVDTKMTAACLHLPFNTYVKIVNLDNMMSVVVRINDRGPYASSKGLVGRPGVKFDLSKGAFEKISHKDKGILNIRVYELEKKPLE